VVSLKFKRDNNEEDDELPPNLPTELRYSTFEMCHLVGWFRWAIENSQFSMLHNFAKFSFVKSTNFLSSIQYFLYHFLKAYFGFH
jgi:hypothetical protein